MLRSIPMTERVLARVGAEAAVARGAALADHLDTPHWRYEFECLRPRDVRSVLELQAEIAAARAAAAATLIGARRLIALRAELDAAPRELVWRDGFRNLVVTVGKNDLLDKYFAGSAYTAAWYLGLISSASYTTGPAAADTMAAHGGWTESTAYSNSNRGTLAFSSASAGSKATSAAVVFNINGTDTIKGGFFVTNNTKSGTTGILYSAGLFTGGDRTVASGDTLNVSATQSV